MSLTKQKALHNILFLSYIKFYLDCPGSFKGLYSLDTLRTHTTKGATFFTFFITSNYHLPTFYNRTPDYS